MKRSIHEWIARGSVSEDMAKRQGLIELVRCRDCKYLQHSYWLDKENGKKCILCIKHRFVGMRDPDWFCADGERGTDNE